LRDDPVAIKKTISRGVGRPRSPPREVGEKLGEEGKRIVLEMSISGVVVKAWSINGIAGIPRRERIDSPHERPLPPSKPN